MRECVEAEVRVLIAWWLKDRAQCVSPSMIACHVCYKYILRRLEMQTGNYNVQFMLMTQLSGRAKIVESRSLKGESWSGPRRLSTRNDK